jgi:FAD/FMN-containing dehydrogenase/Fe-S oxidoreductase
MGLSFHVDHETGEGPPDPLARDLRRVIEGEVRFDRASRALYATDASNYRQIPRGVVAPRSADDVVRTIDLCRAHDASIVLRGGGTSLAGQGCNSGVLIDTSKYLNHVLGIDPEARLAEVEPGCILDDLRAAAQAHGLTFGPDPATHDHNTLGGMLGNNSCGVHSIMSGRTSDNVSSLEIVTYDGVRMDVGATDRAALAQHLAAGGRRAEIFRQLLAFREQYRDLIIARYPRIPRRVSGYENLDQLFEENGFNVARALVGSEGTCVTILRARLDLAESPPCRVLAVLGYEDVYRAADDVPAVLVFKPIGLEGMDDLIVRFIKERRLHGADLSVLPRGRGWLIAEFGAGSAEDACEQAQRLLSHHRQAGGDARLIAEPADQRALWIVREAALGAAARVRGWPATHPGWEDSAVPREALGRYLRDLKALMARHGYDAALYGHFGDGLVHCRMPFDLASEKGLAVWRAFMSEAADLVISYGGSLSGEHGDGQARAAFLEKMYGPEMMQAFRAFRTIWDPAGKMNPGKLIDARPMDADLREGPDYRPRRAPTVFALRDDDGDLSSAAKRCVGVGACRRRHSDEGVMCPSYMATNEERHSTRGRARLLFEFLREGASAPDARAVEEALDFCLSCKGCKSDCPVNVDMATYKAEFRSRYFSRRLRPRAAYSMGLIREWSALAGAMPALANAVLNAPVSSALARWLGGVAPQSAFPRYADEPFSHWFRTRGTRSASGQRVLLWPDTFNDFFRPQTLIAAVGVLESLGYEVTIPPQPLCCGRPLYDWGMLARAKMRWRRTLNALTAEIDARTPIIGVEPACVSAFRDELPNLFPDDQRARRLAKQTITLSEFLARADLPRLPRIDGRALVQIHCHHHAVLDEGAEASVLNRLGMSYEIMKSGCCGMAGSFGFERGKYDLSRAMAERAMAPQIRAAAADVQIIADGFSCRAQIERFTGRTTAHLAEVLAGAFDGA